MDTELMDQQPGPPLPVPSREQRRVRRWLEEAWRHGEIVADDDGLLPEEMKEQPPVAVPLRPSHARAPEDWPEPS
jgi:hypothetical protein